MDTTRPPGIQLGQVFLERATFSHREDFLDLPPNEPLGHPTLHVEFQGGVSPDEKSGFARVTVRSKPEERPLYSLDVAMMALVQVEEEQANMPLRVYVRTAGPAMLYPFVRQVVADLTWRGRFGPLWLSPLNVLAATTTTVEARLAGPVAAPAAKRPKVQGRARNKGRKRK